ncbi:MAG TPA: TonB-dependent receptor, partial [Terriglobia bacterium]
MRWRFWIMFLLLLVIGDSGASAQNLPQTNLKKLSLEELMNIQVTTPSKEPEQILSIPAAIYVITQEDIRRSGVTSIP